MFYSKLNKGFYHPQINYPLPSDAVEISDEEYAALLDGQSQGFEIDFDSDPPSLKRPAPASRESYIERAKLHRTTMESGGVLVAGHWFHSDTPSQIKYVGLVQLAQAALAQGATMNSTLPLNGEPFLWQTMDNGAVQLKISTVLAIPSAIAVHSNACFQACRNHIEQLKIVDDYWDYDYTTNYPEIYSSQSQQ